MAVLTNPSYSPVYEGDEIAGASQGLEGEDLRSLVDSDLVPPGTAIVFGEGVGEVVAQVLSDGRLYADGEVYDGLLELSDAYEIDGNPWSLWSADLPDARVLLSVLRDGSLDNESA
jgi:hypothetical protein